MKPTEEQQAIIDAFGTGEDIRVQAAAGSGKTSTLLMLAKQNPEQECLYVAYNKAIQTDMQSRGLFNVEAVTSHSLAFRAVGRNYKDRLNGPRLNSTQTASLLGVRPFRVSEERPLLNPFVITGLVNDTVRNFTYSSSREITDVHVPEITGYTTTDMLALRDQIVPYARKAWADLQRTDGKLYFSHDCQPPGTLVRRVTRVNGGPGVGKGNSRTGYEDVPIEQIREGDKVVSFRSNQRRGQVLRSGSTVTAVGYRDYSGNMFTAITGRGRRSSYTDTHKCVVRLDCDLAEGNYIVYLARRGNDYRVGRTTWRTRSQGNALGIRRRAMSQRADAMWILSVHETDRDAALAEAMAAHTWRLPTWQFRSPNELMPLDEFWDKVGNNAADARACLAAHALRIDYPFWEKGDGWSSTRRPVMMRALNLRAGMLMLEPDEIKPDVKGFLTANEGNGGWSPITVTRSQYDGPVYNLDVDDTHTYVADGIVTHNCYLKIWALGDPQLDGDVLFLDEAQDANACLVGIVERQTHMQRVVVGDSSQQLYAWRGAQDALKTMSGMELPLSQSFRFGEPIADEANMWLDELDAPLRVRGYDRITSHVTRELPGARAVLCRTNMGCMGEAMTYMNAGKQVAMVGGTQQIDKLAKACLDLQENGSTVHPELIAFDSWEAVVEYSEEHAGSDLKPMVNLINRYGAKGILYATRRFVDEQHADVIVSTAHKAKGREWTGVRIGEDFHQEPDPEDGTITITRADAMLAYVSVTRARENLGVGGLDWIRYGDVQVVA